MSKGFEFKTHDPLKPCPFCGEQEDLSFQTYLCDGWIECGVCDARGPSSALVDVFREKAEDNAAMNWNARGGFEHGLKFG